MLGITTEVQFQAQSLALLHHVWRPVGLFYTAPLCRAVLAVLRCAVLLFVTTAEVQELEET